MADVDSDELEEASGPEDEADRDKERDKEKKEGQEEGEDPLMEFLVLYLSKAMKVKQDKWAKMMATDEYRSVLVDFFARADLPLLVMTVNPGGALVPSTSFAPNSRAKSCYFLRRRAEPVGMDNLYSALVFGDVAGRPMDELAAIAEEVFQPLLTNANNHAGWPSVVAEDVGRQVHEFISTVERIRGATASQTLVPMPAGAGRVYEAEMAYRDSDGEEVDLQLKSSIESAVIGWVAQIGDVIKDQSKAAEPLDELDHWDNRLRNLESIYDQMRDPRVKKMAMYLELTNSTYLPSFKTLYRNLVAAVLEARSMRGFLKTLVQYFQAFADEKMFEETVSTMRPMMHVLGLVWANCRYFCNSERIVSMLQQMSNMVVDAGTRYLDPDSLFQGEPDEMVLMVRRCQRVCDAFVEALEETRETVPSLFADEQAVPWEFHRRTVMQRLIDFSERLKQIETFFDSCLEYNKLEKVVIGGIKGRSLTQKVADVMEDYQSLYTSFGNITYNPLSVDDDGFAEDSSRFTESCQHMDRKLASIFGQAYDDCGNFDAIVKLMQCIGSLVERPIVAEELVRRYSRMLDLLNENLDTVKIIFDEGVREGPFLDKNYPPVAGETLWLHKLRDRTSQPCELFRAFEHEITECEDATYTYGKEQEMLQLLKEREEQIFNAWVEQVPQQCEENLSKPILRRDEDGLLELNFAAELEAILREVKYFRILGKEEDIPKEAMGLFARGVELNNCIQNLNRTIEWYNWLKKDTLPVEADLISAETEEIEGMVQACLEALTWNSDMFPQIDAVHQKLRWLHERVARAQQNIKKVKQSIESWGSVPLYERRDNKPENLLNLEDRQDRVLRRQNQVKASGEEIDRVLNENKRLFFNEITELELHPPPTDEGDEGDEEAARLAVEGAAQLAAEAAAAAAAPSPEVTPPAKKERAAGRGRGRGRKPPPQQQQPKVGKEEEEEPSATASTPTASRLAEDRGPKWLKYLEYVDKVVAVELVKATQTSLAFLDDEMDHGRFPLLEIALELQEPNMVYVPSMREGDSNSLHALVKSILEDVLAMNELVERVDQSRGNNYRVDAELNSDVMEMSNEALSRVTLACEDAAKYCKQFDKYSYLWLDNRSDFLRQFLEYGRMLTPEEQDKIAQADDPSQVVRPSPPSLEQFKDQIDLYEELRKNLEAIESDHLLESWLRIDVRPLRQAILNNVDKWSNMFKQHLVDRVVSSINELEAFMEEAIEEMTKKLDENDYDGLLKVMSYLHKVKERQDATDEMFEKLQNTINLLKNYNVEFSDEVHARLQELPDKWTNTKKVALTTKQQVAPLQANQVNLIRKKLAMFDVRQSTYGDHFKKMSFYDASCQNVYDLIDRTHKEITGLEEEMHSIQQQADLFELNVPEFKRVKQCRRELKLVKQVWDLISIISSCIAAWRTTPWKRIDVDAMEMECKRFTKELRAFEKEVRAWNVYTEMETSIRNLLTSLRAVTELQNPAIRDRHWNQLMQATKGDWTQVKFVMDDDTTLNDLLALNLHEYEDEVKNIVDKSVKEMGMEKILKELNTTWSAMEFSYEIHERTKLKVLNVPEELIETLEDNQVQLQNLMTSKFIDYFLEEVSAWQQKLSNADQVITLWLEVQRKWMYLESIFIGSDDIRRQLPEDSKRFDKIDKDFKDMLNEMIRTPNVVKATNVPGLIERLENTTQELLLCEKALNDYLETKRLAFPRFYFVSSADLLDILSNGNQPELVQRHLPKLFDSMAKLKFVQEGGRNSKRARGMISKELEEYVDFSEVCECSGKVEVWLNRLTDTMRKSLHKYFGMAVHSYDEKPREVWVYDWPAQVALCGTQIWWTTEVNMAFSRLEEGYEYALKDYYKKQVNQLNALIGLLLGDLNAGDRQKIMTICTIDVHSRDVVAKLIQMKVENSGAFQWQAQLRHRWDLKLKNCFANICDAQFLYQYEYLGNTPRLVITPLTDRCYITLTQSLHLIMGGAPAGPAGTGKTETTKDLGRALGVMVYVFNCSEQMDYKSIGNIYKGLSQTGAWGCFDEFNRISVEVLSVVAVQVKTIQDAMKAKKKRFVFLGEEIALEDTVGLFITMNPGYAGRTELPENLKALFRPCAMVVPDFELICEIMLVAEGFQEARLLARKFITLYTLCRELLSKQDHYDWGLRAIKSVLVVAGSLKRSDRQRPEDQVLMRALRDFNVPKIVTDDLPVFMGLIGDLFPALDVPRKRNLEFEKMIKASAVMMKLQPEDNFVLKVVQLEELFAVRHSVFVVGAAGTGKSMVWRTLYKTYQNQKRRPIYNDLNPKAVTNDELFGVISPATREWKDGLFSVIMRDQAMLTGDGPKWIVLDGDIDPMWIESLNTLMDDNKVLTLASNERIALTTHMRLLFEIYSLKTATPATVSRAGILYINPSDLGWNPYVTSWIETRNLQAEKANLTILFDKYVPPCLEVLRVRFKKITPITEIAHIQMLCFLLECLLVPTNVPNDCPKEWYEIYFVFACIWAFGACLFQDQITDWRNEWHKWWTNEFKTIKFPSTGTVFSYFIDEETKKLVPWSEITRQFELDEEQPLQTTLVDTAETTRLRYFLDILVQQKHPVMLVGGAGSGKSVIMGEKLNSLPDTYAVTNVPFNFYTTSEALQRILEKPLEKKAGRNYGPPGNKTMIYFIDDMNMPEVDKYGTVSPHTILRQYLDYSHWYDRIKLTLRDIHNVQLVACMNPTAGSFTINPRLQRHFCVFAVSFPTGETVVQIYSSILSQHLNNADNRFIPSLGKLSHEVTSAALYVHQKMGSTFLPTAVRFHYYFNLRDMSNVFQGMLFSTGDTVRSSTELVRLWAHETCRVYGDKLVEASDSDAFIRILVEAMKKSYEDVNDTAVMEQPLVFCHFATGLGEPKYMPVVDWKSLIALLEEALATYNELQASMSLVLFEDAINHVCRINRILEMPRGNALLVGVGGSGKQSLSRLSAFISTLDVYQIQISKTYGIADLKENLSQLYNKTGLKSSGTVFLMSDAQVAREEFLVLINDLLASGEIPELYPDDEVDNIISTVRNETKSAGIDDTRENCWKFFIDRVRRLLKVVLCFSPVGSTLRVRARKFPALVNCTSIDWFREWPRDALVSVSKRFIAQIEVLPAGLVPVVAQFMSQVHVVVNEMSQSYLLNERRYNYTTPKSFLEQISLYSKLLTTKTAETKARIIRLQSGLKKLASTAEEVSGLKVILADQEVELGEKNQAAGKLIAVLSEENEKVAVEQALATEEEKKVTIIEEDVTIKQKICAEDLSKAEPALIAAQKALNTLNKANLTELKSFAQPPQAVQNVMGAVMVLFSPKGRIPKDRSWKASKSLMNRVDKFLDDLVYFDKENIHPDVIKVLLPYLDDADFDPVKIVVKSVAAAGLCAWVINIHKFYEVFVVVEPKRKALEKANQDLADARAKLKELKEKLETYEKVLNKLKAEFEEATAAKLKCQAEADATAHTIDLANRLVGGLGSENVRWRELVTTLKQSGNTFPGDMLLVSAFISYVGCFSRTYRNDLQNKYWIPYLKTLKPAIPVTEGLDALSLLTDDAQIAAWNNEGLPSDRMSAENATILTMSSRWPLMIDPQLQGLKWIKNRYGSDLKIIRLSTKNYMDIIERSIEDGSTVLLENIGESVDAVLEPVLARNLIKKGRCIKIGDKEIDFNPSFKLILQTKLANPHYKPEMQAQTTLINFTVTRDGLEEQLLTEVVKAERPDLEMMRSTLTKQQNDFKIGLKALEDDLLQRLSSAGDNILQDTALVENLETTKRTAAEIEEKSEEAKTTAAKLDEAREMYRPAAARGSLLYFILSELYKINIIYQFSLKAFNVVFKDAMGRAEAADKMQDRLNNLLDSITFSVFRYVTRGLFVADKLTFMSQVLLQILSHAGEVDAEELDFLLRFPVMPNQPSPVDFLSNSSWGGIKSLSLLKEFHALDKDIEGSAKRWKKYVDSECPEKEKFPQEWKNKSALQRLCMMRALRPDRMTYAMLEFIEEKLGPKYVGARAVEFAKSFEETSNATPTFFILSPGVNPIKDVERLGKKLGFTFDAGTLVQVSLGQGQEEVAETAMDEGSEKGYWVVLENIHLVAKWLPQLEKKMEQYMESSHEDYRLYLTAEAAMDPQSNVLPQGILESSIKITNEPPSGMLANIHMALDNFSQETLEMCSKEAEFKAILFSLCYFHAVVAERRKFGAQGWNRLYPFNVGDLTISVSVLYNYLENNTKVPWEDLRYLFGEIMYGGHITDDWDRRLCRTYLQEYMVQELIDSEIKYAPDFGSPPNLDYAGYHKYVDENLPPESPYLYGLHPNAEIGFLTSSSERLFRTLLEMQPRDSGATGLGTATPEEKVRSIVDDLLDRLPEEFGIADMMARIDDRTPFIIVAFQECERMNILTREMHQRLTELDLGLKGELTMTADMERLQNTLFMDLVDETWTRLAYPSTLPLGQWFADLLLRYRELESWTADFMLPSSVWLAGFFNPQSFLTAIMQQTARKNEWPLDKMCLNCDVTKKSREEFTAPPREGAYVHGLYMEGARWDTQTGGIAEARLKELFPTMPVIFIKAITQDKQDLRGVYECPVYKTRQRGPTFVWTFNLRSRLKAAKWTLAGVALILQI